MACSYSSWLQVLFHCFNVDLRWIRGHQNYLVNKCTCNENVANEIWLFPQLIHLSAKAIQSHIHEQNEIDNCSPSYATKALHLASWPDRRPTVQNRELSKMQIILYTRALRCSFSPAVKKSQSSLHWDCIPFFVKCNQSDNQFTQIKPQNAEQNERSQIKEQKWPSLVLCSVDTETSPEAPEKTYRRSQIAVQKNLDFSWLQTKLGCILSFLENTNMWTSYLLTGRSVLGKTVPRVQQAKFCS